MPKTSITIWFPELPPTANKLYYMGTRLKNDAREYRERFKMYVVQHYLHEFGEMPQPNRKAFDKKSDAVIDVATEEPNLLFGLDLKFYMDCLTTWGDENLYKSQRAKFRFKKTDLSNRIKFIEDCFKHSMDIDDSLTFVSSQMKIHSPKQEGVMITYYVIQPEQVAVPRAPGGTM
jgi:Holliday junction resolvase RusA-like endonuclease